jgi:hypothetical protein
MFQLIKIGVNKPSLHHSCQHVSCHNFLTRICDYKFYAIRRKDCSHKRTDVPFTKNHVIMILSLPTHCTNHVQLLDMSVYGPLRTYYDQEMIKSVKCQPGRTIRYYQIAGLHAEACGKAATCLSAMSRFSKA